MARINAKVEDNFWEGKRVFITGHTGFKGSWLSLWLQKMGSIVKGYALEPNTKPNLFTEARVGAKMTSEIGDITNLQQITESMVHFNPEVLFHMAAQPLVRRSYVDPVLTFSTNVMGTVNVLEAARKCSNLKAIVSVTTDKCYENKEWVWGYRENEPMGGDDPYSSSKSCSELVIKAYRKSFFNGAGLPYLASVRAGNVIGGGDWSEDRLIPDIIRAFEKGECVKIRNPDAVRPWQHVLEPLSGYLILAQNLHRHGVKFAEGWNFGPNEEGCKPVNWILEKMVANWGNGVFWQTDRNKHPHEANYLKLDCSKAAVYLNWEPKWNLGVTLEKTVQWYKQFNLGKNMQEECLFEIEEYQEKYNE
jgi:CDP-glucose 4,6-dehydratase